MTNVKDTFIRAVSSVNPLVKCAIVIIASSKESKTFRLKTPHTQKEYEQFLESINFEYNRIEQLMLGTIWMSDGSWFSRETYGNLSHWQYQKCPIILEELKNEK